MWDSGRGRVAPHLEVRKCGSRQLVGAMLSWNHTIVVLSMVSPFRCVDVAADAWCDDIAGTAVCCSSGALKQCSKQARAGG